MMIRTTTILIVLMTVLACTNSHQASTTRNEALVRRYFEEAWNKGDTAVLDTLLTPDYINHTPSDTAAGTGIAGLKIILMKIRRGFPDLHYDIRELVVTKDRVVARVIMTGTQSDSLFNLPPTGKKVQVNQVNIEQITNGRISEHWRVTDELTMMKQLGLVP